MLSISLLIPIATILNKVAYIRLHFKADLADYSYVHVAGTQLPSKKMPAEVILLRIYRLWLFCGYCLPLCPQQFI